MISGRKIARNVMSMASTTTTDATTAQVVDVTSAETSSVTSDPPELVKTIQQAVRNLIKLIFIFNVLVRVELEG